MKLVGISHQKAEKMANRSAQELPATATSEDYFQAAEYEIIGLPVKFGRDSDFLRADVWSVVLLSAMVILWN